MGRGDCHFSGDVALLPPFHVYRFRNILILKNNSERG